MSFGLTLMLTLNFGGHTELLTSDKAEFLKLTYQDNECTPKSFIDKVAEAREKASEGNAYYINWVKVYADGETGMLGRSSIRRL